MARILTSTERAAIIAQCMTDVDGIEATGQYANRAACWAELIRQLEPLKLPRTVMAVVREAAALCAEPEPYRPVMFRDIYGRECCP